VGFYDEVRKKLLFAGSLYRVFKNISNKTSLCHHLSFAR